jgi:hypothetical protein
VQQFSVIRPTNSVRKSKVLYRTRPTALNPSVPKPFTESSRSTANVEHSMVSLISSSFGVYRMNICVEFTDVNKLINKTSSKCQFEASARDFFFSCSSLWMNSASYEYINMSTKKGRNVHPLEFQQTIGRPDCLIYDTAFSILTFTMDYSIYLIMI